VERPPYEIVILTTPDVLDSYFESFQSIQKVHISCPVLAGDAPAPLPGCGDFSGDASGGVERWGVLDHRLPSVIPAGWGA